MPKNPQKRKIIKNDTKIKNKLWKTDHIIFPEVNFDKVDKIRGLDITIVTNSKNKKETLELLKEFNFPLTNK